MRDVEVQKFCDLMDKPEKFCRPDSLTKGEFDRCMEELYRCQTNVRYACRNYIWLVDQQKRDSLMDLWPSQLLVLEEMEDLKARGRPQKIYALKAREVGLTLFGLAMIACKSFFFPNNDSLVVSYDPLHNTKCFAIVLNMYDRLPWWLKPQFRYREYKTGIVLENPNDETRGVDPGLKSNILVKAVTSYTSIGQGFRLAGFLGSEMSDWPEQKVKQILDEDVKFAILKDPDSFGLLETTGGTDDSYAEKLWMANVELLEQAEWRPVFLPFFFERNRWIQPENGWNPTEREVLLRKKISEDWVQCDQCEKFNIGRTLNRSFVGEVCWRCKKGVFHPYILNHGQLRYMWEEYINAEAKGDDALKRVKTQLASTPQDSFQAMGLLAFPEDVINFVSLSVSDPIYIGAFDENGYFHAVADASGRCLQSWCRKDHKFDTGQFVRIWEMPDPRAEYQIGSDIGHGKGDDKDYSVGFVNKLGGGHRPDVHVATLRTNVIDAYTFAEPLQLLGKMFNNAELAIEYNNLQTTADRITNDFNYPNIYRSKKLSKADGKESTSLHWITPPRGKRNMVNTAIGILRKRAWVVRDPLFAFEMKHFKEEELNRPSSHSGGSFHDDLLIAGLITLVSSHEMDASDSVPVYTPVNFDADAVDNYRYRMQCGRCERVWGLNDLYVNMRCPDCGSYLVSATPNHRQEVSPQPEEIAKFFAGDLSVNSNASLIPRSYDSL